MSEEIKYDVRQVNNYDNLSYADTYTIKVPYLDENSKITTKEENVRYLTAISNKEIIKMGYCCERKGIIYPIYLTIKNQGTFPFNIGRDGMYEVQPENLENDITDAVVITEILVPEGIKFTLEYVCVKN